VETVDKVGGARPTYFTGLVIDAAPELLRESYRLRYQVYCLDRRFLPAEDYPDGLEVDVYDGHSVHLGVVTSTGELAATARLVELSDAGLPMLDHCSIFTDETSLFDTTRHVVEISRLVSPKYSRRAGDGYYSLQGATDRRDGEERRGNVEPVLTLYKTIYQTSKRRGFTHWLAASEKSLYRLLVRYGFPFRAIGPETDYHGSVAPYLMDLRELDQTILGRQMPMLHDFLNGLEPEFSPGEHERDLQPTAR
jgi:N-acyl amino acid synthase of PEP-CTERM/exosortase system